jgi:hypothetical protein
MNTRTLAGILLIAWLVALTAASAGAQGPQVRSLSASPAAGAKFTFYDVDSDLSHDYGQYPSLAINPLTDTPYVSYYDAVGKKLRLAHMVSSGGNCGYDGHRLAWSCETVPMYAAWATDDVGQHASMAIYSTGGASPQWKLGIAYYNATPIAAPPPTTSKGLFYTVYDCGTTGSCTWTTYWIDSAAQLYYTIGRIVSLKFDSAGNPRIAYGTGESSGSNEIRYARYLGGSWSGAGCHRSDWQCDTAVAVHLDHSIAESISLDLDGADRPHIAYSAIALLGGFDLKYAWFIGSGGNCGPSGSWQCDMIAASEGGPDVSLQVSKGPIAVPRIAYYSYTSGMLFVRLATRRLGGGGYCGPSNSWQCDMIDSMEDSPGFRGISLVEDSQGYPVIAYRDSSAAGGGRLKWAQPIIRLGLPAGNCGPMSGPSNAHTWQCDLVGGPYGAVFGRQASLALNSAGLAYIASYDDTPPGFLEISFQQHQVYLPLTRR